MTSSRLLARNSALNLSGQVLPLIVAVAAIPPLVRGLGAERFGVLTLAWAAIGYFSLFELGLSRALTQAVAQRLGKGAREELPAVTWTALLLLLLLGTLGAIVLAVATPALVGVLKVPEELRAETIHSFWILAASLPLVVTSVGLRGVMEAHQHFGAATALRIPLVVFMFLGPLLVLPFSRSLVPAVSVLAAVRAIGFAAHLAFCLRTYPFLRGGIVLSGARIAPLLRFGGWTTVSNVVSPMMVYLDRFIIGAMLSLAAVAHYVTPYEVVVKLLIIPIAILAVMFPAFASTAGRDPERMRVLYDRSLRAVMLVMFPIALVAVTLAREALAFWVGPVLPEESATVLQWLAVGVFINAMAQPPLSALQSAGRPDLVAKLHLLELPLYAIGIVVLVRTLGIQGVAIAWTLRIGLDTVALLWIARRRLAVGMLPAIGGAWSVPLMLTMLAVGALIPSVQLRIWYVGAALLLFAPFVWLMLLSEPERDGLRAWIRRPISVSVAGTEGLS